MQVCRDTRCKNGSGGAGGGAGGAEVQRFRGSEVQRSRVAVAVAGGIGGGGEV
jgi:hypothetical protein